MKKEGFCESVSVKNTNKKLKTSGKQIKISVHNPLAVV